MRRPDRAAGNSPQQHTGAACAARWACLQTSARALQHNSNCMSRALHHNSNCMLVRMSRRRGGARTVVPGRCRLILLRKLPEVVRKYSPPEAPDERASSGAAIWPGAPSSCAAGLRSAPAGGVLARGTAPALVGRGRPRATSLRCRPRTTGRQPPRRTAGARVTRLRVRAPGHEGCSGVRGLAAASERAPSAAAAHPAAYTAHPGDSVQHAQPRAASTGPALDQQVAQPCEHVSASRGSSLHAQGPAAALREFGEPASSHGVPAGPARTTRHPTGAAAITPTL